jgi:hypothetical protein
MKRLMTVICFLSFFAALAAAAPLASNSAVLLVNGAALYEDTNKVLKALDYLALGDILTLMNKTGTFSENKKDQDFTRIKAPNGKEGWVRTQFIATKATLAIVKADKAVIYSEPRDVKLTSRFISGMTLVAVLQDGSTSTFAKVQGYDAAQGRLFTDATFVSTSDLTVSDNDVNAGILYDVAAVTKDPVLKKNLLTVAMRKYSGSIFLDKIQTGLGISSNIGEDSGSDTGP